MSQSPRSKVPLDSILQVIVSIYQGVAVLGLIVSLVLASRWLKTPFLGAFFEQTMLRNHAAPSEPSTAWVLFDQTQFRDQLIAVNGVPVRTFSDMERVLNGTRPGVLPIDGGDSSVGSTIPLTIRKYTGGEQTLDVTLGTLPLADRWTYIFIPAIFSVLFLILGLWIFGLRRGESSGRAFALFSSSLAILSGTLFDLYTTHSFTYLWTLGLAVLGGSLVDMAMLVPQGFHPAADRPQVRWIGYLIGLILAGYAYITLNNFQDPTAYIRAWQYLYLFVAVCALVFFGFIVQRAVASPSPVVKSQARIILMGALSGLVVMVIWLANMVFGWFNFPFTIGVFLPLLLFSFALGYIVLRSPLIQADVWMRQSLLYILLTILLVGGIGIVVSGLTLLIKGYQPFNNPWAIIVLAFVFATLLNPVRNRLQTMLDGTLFRGQHAYLDRQQDFAHKLTSVVDQQGISLVLRESVMNALAPDRMHIYVFDGVNDQYAAAPGDDNRPTSDIRFSPASPFVQYLEKERLALFLDGTGIPPGLKPEAARLALLGTRLHMGFFSKERLLGWLALGSPLSGQPYTPKDLAFLDNLCQQTALSLERARTVSDLERRVQEMNALTRVSQGVNITLAFDDVLELIYAQTSQVIPAADFHITLYNQTTDFLFHAFCVEEHERVEHKENKILPPNTGLAQDVILKGRPLITQDYTAECLSRYALPGEQGIHAWMGVPLNTGAQTIGMLSVGSRDPSVTYTRTQLELLQNIADHTAGAIVKSRLLQETEQRARQLSTLNEVTRQLTSTLQSEPLLNNILENAVSILNCEAGNLFLIDERSDDLILKVTVGLSASSSLVVQRVPPGSGIVGRAVQTRLPIIENNTRVPDSQHSAADEKTGFFSRTSLAVPLKLQDRVLGVIELINRRDRLPFGEEDQDLLTAFAGQAAVAIENVRLYTLTDQELAARVEELSVMQRIDRELNASLEMERAMRITLEWAMRQSRAQAGLIGMLMENNLSIMAHQGYGNHLAGYEKTPMPLDLPALRQAVTTGLPQHQTLDPAMGGSLLPDAIEQIVIPIRREAQVIGLLMLESLAAIDRDITFLNRLSDHAAIAIANAQLYAEVQNANIAKSDFVSFVAHELKNPMTSIKGYTELIAGGKVGTVNEMQANFLRTISTNVERMSTLVSDLNDNSKIEAGRLRLDFQAMHVDEVVDEVVGSTRRQIEDKKQTVEVALPEGLPSVWADPTRVAQALTNVVSNAHKYTPEQGQIFVGGEVAPNQWDPEGAPRVVHLWIRDTGIGISTADQAKIFQKFFRSDDEKAREAPGTGLGLNITKSLVEMQGGRIWFESEFRKGTTFHITIPVAEG